MLSAFAAVRSVWVRAIRRAVDVSAQTGSARLVPEDNTERVQVELSHQSLSTHGAQNRASGPKGAREDIFRDVDILRNNAGDNVHRLQRSRKPADREERPCATPADVHGPITHVPGGVHTCKLALPQLAHHRVRTTGVDLEHAYQGFFGVARRRRSRNGHQ